MNFSYFKGECSFQIPLSGMLFEPLGRTVGPIVLDLLLALVCRQFFLLAFQPGAHWSYFPNVVEILITVGLVAGEIGLEAGASTIEAPNSG